MLIASTLARIIGGCATILARGAARLTGRTRGLVARSRLAITSCGAGEESSVPSLTNPSQATRIAKGEQRKQAANAVDIGVRTAASAHWRPTKNAIATPHAAPVRSA